MPNNVPNAPGGNEGQTDQGRGDSGAFTYDKGQRKTGRTGGVGTSPNQNTVDGNKKTNSDPRLTPSS
jgi:hypothetical protein